MTMPQLKAIAPYSFDLFCQILSRYPQASLFHLRDGDYYRVLRYAEQLSLIKINSSSTVDAPKLQIEFLVGEEAAIEQVEHLLGLDCDINDFYEFAHQNEALWAIVEPLYGLPIDRSENVFHALIFVIIEQHISWVNAQKAQRVLVEWSNNSIEYEGIKHYAMPTVQQLANATIDDLRPLKITFKRMQLMIDLARQVLDGTLDLEAMTQLPPAEMYRELMKIKGVGHWTASVVLSRARGIFPYVPQNDVALQAAVREYFNVEKSTAATQAIFAEYGQFAGLAAHFTLMKWVLDKYPIVNG
jgi:DNA-3-methyladenine glycosylase II